MCVWQGLYCDFTVNLDLIKDLKTWKRPGIFYLGLKNPRELMNKKITSQVINFLFIICRWRPKFILIHSVVIFKTVLWTSSESSCPSKKSPEKKQESSRIPRNFQILKVYEPANPNVAVLQSTPLVKFLKVIFFHRALCSIIIAHGKPNPSTDKDQLILLFLY